MAPIASSHQIVLTGRVVTMDGKDTVYDRGAVCVQDGVVAAVVRDVADVPGEFAGVRAVASGGTIYPGLIELHNHLPYDILRLWQVPRMFTNRDQWRADSVPDYRKLISGAMGVLGR